MSRPQEELSMSTKDVPDLGSHTVAWFRSSAEVRAAESALERDGIESHYIEVSRPPVASNRREIDRKTWGSLGTRAAVGVVIGAAIGALVGVVVGLLLGNTGTDLFGFAFAGFIAGGPLGGIYTVAVRMPTQEQSFDTYGAEGARDESEWIAVGGPDDVQSHAAEVLQSQHPVRIDGHAA